MGSRPDLRIERTEVHDLVRGLDRIIFPGDDPPDIEGSRWWLVWDRDTPVAFAGARMLSGEPILMLERCGVLPSHRGHGLQLRLIRARMRWAYEARADAAITYTHPGNPASGNSLIRAGFTLYTPSWAWAGPHFLYWRRDLT